MKSIKLDAFTTLMKIIFTLSFLCSDDVFLKWKSASYLFITYFTYMMQKENIKSLIQKVRCSVERNVESVVLKISELVKFLYYHLFTWMLCFCYQWICR